MAILSDAAERMTLRPATPKDLQDLAPLRAKLWPDESPADHHQELMSILDGAWSTHFPYVIFVAETETGELVGFAEVTIRSRADGCDPLYPVGYLEGWYVSESHRNTGIGKRLVEHGEAWAKAQGCKEFASDTWFDNPQSQKAHEALGFAVVDRCVHYRKSL